LPEKKKTERKRRFIQDISHYLIGFSILAKGYAKLEHYQHQLGEIIFIFLAGIFIILGAAFHHKLEKRIKNFSASFHIAEGAAFLMVGWILFKEGSVRLHYFCFFIGAVYIMIGLTFLFGKKDNKEKQQLRLQLWIGTAFLGAGLLAFILNQLHNTSTWATVISVIMICVGLLMAVRSKLKKQAGVFSKMK